MKMNNKPLWHGVILIAGGAIGAGMFALPVVAAGMWFKWAIFGFSIVWLFTYLAALLLLDVNLQFKAGASFHTIVKHTLGLPVAWLNNLAIAFIMMVLMYAYITAGASIVEHSFKNALNVESLPHRGFLSISFATAVGLFVWLGTAWVSRLSSLLMVGLVSTFVLANTNLSLNLNWASLVSTPHHFSFIWAALPVFVTAFACGGLIPSLTKYYANDRRKIQRSLLIGTLLVLFVYVIWLMTTLGSLSRDIFAMVIRQGGNVGDLVQALQQAGATEVLKKALDWFSHFAIITSFLSIGLGLFHFLSDGLSLANSRLGRLQSVALTFLPPAVLSYLYPYGFVNAIGYAGLLVAISFFIVPAAMHIKQYGIGLRACLVLMFGMLIGSLKILVILDWLPRLA